MDIFDFWFLILQKATWRCFDLGFVIYAPKLVEMDYLSLIPSIWRLFITWQKFNSVWQVCSFDSLAVCQLVCSFVKHKSWTLWHIITKLRPHMYWIIGSCNLPWPISRKKLGHRHNKCVIFWNCYNSNNSMFFLSIMSNKSSMLIIDCTTLMLDSTISATFALKYRLGLKMAAILRSERSFIHISDRFLWHQIWKNRPKLPQKMHFRCW